MKLSLNARDETHPLFSVPYARRLIFTQCSSDTFNASGYYNRVINTMSALQLQGLFLVNNSTMRRPTETCFCSKQKTTVLCKNNEAKNPIKIANAVLPAAYVIVAGPAISCFPLGSLAPIFAILATSFASTYSDMKAIGIAVILIQGCGLSGLEGRMLALLSFLSFSSTFGKPNCHICVIAYRVLTAEQISWADRHIFHTRACCWSPELFNRHLLGLFFPHALDYSDFFRLWPSP